MWDLSSALQQANKQPGEFSLVCVFVYQTSFLHVSSLSLLKTKIGVSVKYSNLP